MSTAEESLKQFMADLDPTPTDDEITFAHVGLVEIGNADDERRVARVEGWHVTDDNTANWALRRIAMAEKANADVQELYDRQLAQLNAWRQAEIARNDRTVQFFAGKLESYWLPQYEADPKANKTKKLPHGTIQFKKQPDEYPRDEDKLLAEAKTKGLPVRVKESADWAEIKKDVDKGPQLLDGSYKAVLKSTGEVLESVRIVERPDKFVVKVGE